MISLGYHDKDEFYETARLSFYGEQVLELDKIERSPLRRTIQSILMPFN